MDVAHLDVPRRDDLARRRRAHDDRSTVAGRRLHGVRARDAVVRLAAEPGASSGGPCARGVDDRDVGGEHRVPRDRRRSQPPVRRRPPRARGRVDRPGRRSRGARWHALVQPTPAHR